MGKWGKCSLFSWINPCVPMGKIRAVADETFCRLETAVGSSTVRGAVVFPNTSSKISSMLTVLMSGAHIIQRSLGTTHIEPGCTPLKNVFGR